MTEMLAWLGAWYNLAPLLLLLIGCGLVLVELVTGGLGDVAGGDVDLDVDIAVDLDVDIDLDLDVEVPEIGLFGYWLSWLGLGVVPISILIEISTITFGGTVLLVNAIARDFLPWTGGACLLVSLPAGFAVMVVVTHYMGRGLARLLGLDGEAAPDAGSYIGKVGTVLTTLTDKIGEVEVRPPEASPVIVNTRRGGSQNIKRGSTVCLVTYDREARVYRAAELNEREE